MARNSYDMDDNMKSSESETYDKTKNQSRNSHKYSALNTFKAFKKFSLSFVFIHRLLSLAFFSFISTFYFSYLSLLISAEIIHLLSTTLFIAAIIHFRIQSFPAPTLSENFP